MADEQQSRDETVSGGGAAPGWERVNGPEVSSATPTAGSRPYGAGSYPAPPPAAYAAAGISPGMSSKPKSRRWIAWTLGVVAVLLLLATLGGIKLWHVFQSAGKEEIVPLHAAMAREDAGAIFNAADPAYQSEVGEERSAKLFASIHEAMGSPLSYSVQNVSANTSTADGQQMTLILNTKFSKGDGVERIVYRKVGADWKLLGYHCRSPLLAKKTEEK